MRKSMAPVWANTDSGKRYNPKHEIQSGLASSRSQGQKLQSAWAMGAGRPRAARHRDTGWSTDSQSWAAWQQLLGNSCRWRHRRRGKCLNFTFCGVNPRAPLESKSYWRVKEHWQPRGLHQPSLGRLSSDKIRITELISQKPPPNVQGEWFAHTEIIHCHVPGG